MQTQDVSDDFLLRFWPWLEANRNRVIAISGVVLVALFVWYYLNSRQQEKQLAAGQAYTEFLSSQPAGQQLAQMVEGYTQIADQYAGTLAGQRAQLQAALGLFTAGKYADAETKFQGFVAANRNSPLLASAELGVAASLEAQGKLDQALTEYRMVTTTYPDTPTAVQAKYDSARVLAAQGKLSESSSAYQDVMRSPLAGSLASMAHQRMADLQPQLDAQKANVHEVTPQKTSSSTNSAK